jgi:polysaccharide export outer membrane protein
MQLRDIVAKGLATYISEPEVSIIVKEIHSDKVSVVGSVKKPDRYELHSQATVLEALAMAGGLTDFAKRDRIVVYRREGTTWKTLEFNYTKVVSDWDVQQNFVLMPGDIVVVP